MKKYKHVLSAALLAAQIITPTFAANITVAAGALPPHINADGSGREAEIITATLQRCGHSVTYKVLPFTRHWKSYEKSDQVDAVSTVPAGVSLPGYRSVTYVKYHNGITTLASSNMNVSSLADLAGKRVVGFGDAQYIVPGLGAAVPTFKSYKEQTDQLIQSKLLFSGRVDAIVGDGLILSAFNNELIGKAKTENLRFDPSQDIEFKAIFEPTDYNLMFKSENLKNDFDKCYEELLQSGIINGINQKYVDEHSKVVTSEYEGL